MAFYAVQVPKAVKTKVVWKERALPPKSSEATYSKWVIKWGRCLFLELFFQGNVWKCITVGLGRLIVLLCGVQAIWFALKSCPRLRIFLFCCCCVIVILQVSGEEGFNNVFWFILWTRSKLTLQSIEETVYILLIPRNTLVLFTFVNFPIKFLCNGWFFKDAKKRPCHYKDEITIYTIK